MNRPRFDVKPFSFISFPFLYSCLGYRSFSEHTCLRLQEELFWQGLMAVNSEPPLKIACAVDGSRRTRSTFPGLDLLKCLLCRAQKNQRYNRRLKEPLVRCTWECTPFTLRNTARVRKDDGVLMEIEHRRSTCQGCSTSQFML